MCGDVNNIIYFSSIFNGLRMVVGATSSIYLLNHGMNIFEFGLLRSIQSIVYFFLDIPTSYLADKYSRKYALLLAAFFGALWLLLTGLSNSVGWFFFAEILNSISLTIIGGIVYAYIIDNSGDSANSINLLNKVNRLQFFLMAITSFAGSLLYMIDPKWPWLISGACCLVLSVVGIWILPTPIIMRREQKLPFLESIKEGILNKELFWAGANLVLLLVIFQIMLQYWQLMVGSEFSLKNSGVFYGVVFSMILLSQSLAGQLSIWLSKNKNLPLLIAIASFFILLSLSFFALKDVKYAFLILIVLIFGFLQATIAIARGYYHSMAASENRSVYESILTTTSRLLVIFLLPLIAYFSQGSRWSVIFFVLALFSLLNIINCLPRRAVSK